MKGYVDEEYLTYLSHWMFGTNEMVGGDQITITTDDDDNRTDECGVSFVYDDESIEEEEEDVLGYYKSWNYIIGGDLSGFQTTTGEYILHIWRFEDKIVSFRAFSKRKSDIHTRAHEDVKRLKFTAS